MSRQQHKSRHLSSQQHTADQGNDSVNHIASLLLDSPELGHPDGLASHPSNYVDLSNMGGPKQPAAAQTQDSLGRSPQKEQGKRTSPAIPRKSSLRRRKNQLRADLISNDKADLSRLMPKSKTGALNIQTQFHLSQRKSRDSLKCVPLSKTAPLNTAFGDAADTDDVSKKLQNMLAATEALKPRAKKQDSRVSRMSHKLANKASRAWGRLQGKKAPPETTVRGRISAPLELGGGLQLQAGPGVVVRPDSLTDLVNVKETVNDGDSVDGLEQYQSSIDHSIKSNPFTDGSVQSSPKTPIRQTGSANAAALTPTNPFDSDPDFSTDLKAVLTERPLGASTPRARRKRDSAALFNVPSLEKHAVRGRVLGEHTPVLPHPDDGNDEDYDGLFTEMTQHAGPLYMSSKKYPSPDKESLAHLAHQLRQMGIQGPAPGCDQQDELSHSFGADRLSPRTLVPRDRNLPLSRYTAKSEVGICTPASLRKSRIPRPAGSTRSEARYGLVTHPDDPAAMESDELA